MVIYMPKADVLAMRCCYCSFIGDIESWLVGKKDSKRCVKYGVVPQYLKQVFGSP